MGEIEGKRGTVRKDKSSKKSVEKDRWRNKYREKGTKKKVNI